MLDDLLDRSVPTAAASVLVLGAGRWWVTGELRARGARLEVIDGDWPSIQLPRRHRLAIVEPGGCELLAPGPDDSLAVRFDLVPVAETDLDL